MKKFIKEILIVLAIVTVLLGFPLLCVKIGSAGMSGGGTGTGTVTGVTGTSPIVSSEGTAPAISLTLLKDLVTTAPLTGGTDNIFPGTDADITIAIPPATSIADGYLTSTDWSTFNAKASTTTPTFTGTSTFNGDIVSTGVVSGVSVSLTGSGQSSLNAGLVVNEDGGSTADDVFRVESNTEANMILTTPSTDIMTLGGSSNATQIAKGGQVSFIGTNAGNTINGLHWEKNFTIIAPSQAYSVGGSSICVITKMPKAVTITNIEVTANADPTTEIDGDLKYCDTFIGLANPTIINAIDTTNGALSDSSITSGGVAAGKCMYLNLHAQPDNAMTQLAFTISGYYQ